ncbi:MAG: leucine-rich repeat protein [Clostridia bacterium]|nr:leucine-rich repeat protein [Clostridia bacterium]
MKKSKIIAVIFVVLAAVLVFSVSAFAAETEYTYGKYKYTITENDTVKITKYKGTKDTVTIPKEIDGKTVTHIGKDAFGEECPTQKIIIPDCVTTIERDAFDFSNVKTVEIGSGVTEIDTNAFFRAWKLEKIIVSDKNTSFKAVDGILYDKAMKTLIRVPAAKTVKKLVIPEGVETIGNNATRYVTLESIVIPSTVKKIDTMGLSFNGAKNLVIPGNVENLEMDAIYYCNGLEKIEIKKGKLKSLDFEDIHACKELKTIIIPENVEYIDRFNDCDSLEEIIVSENNKNYTTVDGVLYNKAKTEILVYPLAKADETFVIPSSVTVIGDDAFNSIYDKSLKKIYMHVGVREIEEWAFIYSRDITILYEGTKAQFDAIKKQDDFNIMVSDVTYNNYIHRSVENITSTAKDTAITLTWDKVPGAAGYRVYVKSGSSWKALKTTTARSYTAEGLSSGTTYTFAIKYYTKENGKTVWDSELVTVKATTELGVTSSLKSTAATDSVTLKWSAVQGADGYRVFVKNTATGKWDIAVRTTGKKTTATIEGLEPGKKYTFAVRAYVNNGSIVWAPKYKSVSAVTRPGLTEKITSTAGDRWIRLNWSKVPGATGYRVYLLKNGAWKALKTTTGLYYYLMDVDLGKEYTFAVKAYTKVDGNTYWASEYVEISGVSKPGYPDGTTKVISSTRNSVTISWDKVDYATGYRVYIYNTETGKWDTAVKNTTKLTATVDGLSPNESYTLAVRAYIKHGTSYIWSEGYSRVNVKTAK